jgi:uncharacterized protein (TIGR04255 family)
MPFPETPRVIYEKNPLDLVICQIRFPPILRIETEIPARFQEVLRIDYPLLREQPTLIQPPGLPADFANLAASLIPGAGRKGYEFVSADENWRVTLFRSFVSLTCNKYSKWEHFKERLRPVLAAFVEQYQPTFYLRLGLRYRDVIVRSKLNLEKSNWGSLLQPQVAGELASNIAPSVEDVSRQVVLRQSKHEGKITVQHGTVRLQDTNEECYCFDIDLFTDRRTELDQAEQTLDDFNRQSGRLFRWCISDELHRAMGPVAVD